MYQLLYSSKIILYKYFRHTDVSNLSTNTIHDVYIDTLSADPSSVSPSTVLQ